MIRARRLVAHRLRILVSAICNYIILTGNEVFWNDLRNLREIRTQGSRLDPLHMTRNSLLFLVTKWKASQNRWPSRSQRCNPIAVLLPQRDGFFLGKGLFKNARVQGINRLMLAHPAQQEFSLHDSDWHDRLHK